MFEIAQQLGVADDVATVDLSGNKYASLLGLVKPKPAPVVQKQKRPGNQERQINRAVLIKAIHKMITEAPSTTDQVAKAHGIKNNTAFTYLASLRSDGLAKTDLLPRTAGGHIWKGL